MVVTDLFAGEIATELIKQLVKITRKCTICKSAAESLHDHINDLLPVIHEIRYSGVELKQFRLDQINRLDSTLKEGLALCNKILSSSRWHVYKNFQQAKKLEKIDKYIRMFMTSTINAHVMADVHHSRVEMEVRFDRMEAQATMMLEGKMGAMRIGGGWIEEEVKRLEEEQRERDGLVVNFGVGLVVGKRKVKELLLVEEEKEGCMGVIGVSGIGGSGKTTLAKEISRDEQVKSHFRNGVIFQTVSQSPNVEQLKQNILRQIIGDRDDVNSNFLDPQWKFQNGWRIKGRTLVILDDVWSLPELKHLIFNIPGCKFLVVSRFKFPTVVSTTYDLELLRDDEAISLFCYTAFGQTCIPFAADEKLVKQIVKECKGLPLALKVIGASLRGQPQMLWTSAKEILSRGGTLGESHEIELLKRMEVSLEYLHEKVKECFLDLGSFPEDKKIPLDVLINMWVEARDIHEKEAFAILLELSNKNLVTLTKDERTGSDTHNGYFETYVTQHDVLRDLALRLSNNGNVNERRRLFMLKKEESLPREWERCMDKPFEAQIVSIHTGEMKEFDWPDMYFPKAEVLILNFSSSEYYLPPFICRMPKLRALVLINSDNSNTVLHNWSTFAYMHNLRSLWLEKVTVPHPLPHTTVPLRNLRKISLILCKFSNSLDDSVLHYPHILPRLTELTLDHCINLTKLPSSICMITSLTNLSITNCHELHDLPNELGNLKSVQNLRLCACPSLKKLPGSICELENLQYLDISQCVNLRSLPDKMGRLIRLEKIDMRECSMIRILPPSIVSLRRSYRVICDEEASWLWKEVEKVVPELKIQVVKECFSMDWLSD